jgi:glutaredoxin 3
MITRSFVCLLRLSSFIFELSRSVSLNNHNILSEIFLTSHFMSAKLWHSDERPHVLLRYFDTGNTMIFHTQYVVLLLLAALLLQVLSVSSAQNAVAFVSTLPNRHFRKSVLSYILYRRSSIVVWEMKRPLLDQIAATIFQLETNRVQASSVVDDQGRVGEPMEWSEDSSLANQFSKIMAQNPIGYRFKQWIADIIAGDFDEEKISAMVDDYVGQRDVVMFSFTTCPFCRRAKDVLDERGIQYLAVELDELQQGNEIRAILGRKTKRTSMPNIFIRGQCIGGCNDGYPGLLPLIQSGEFDALLAQK